MLKKLLFISLLGLVLQCHLQEATHEEKYVSVKLDDSLSRFDSVQVCILVAADTSVQVGKIWDGPLLNPGSLPDYRLSDDELRPLAIRVRAFDGNGVLALDMLISKVDGIQVVKILPLALPKASTHLASLQVTPGHLLPVFDSTWIEYQVNYAFEESFLTMTVVSTNSSAIMHIGNALLTSGVPSKPMHLNVGENQISIKVIADAESTIYTVNAMRAHN